MKIVIRIIFLVGLIFCFMSCTDPIKDKLEGIWYTDIDDSMIQRNGWYNISVNAFVINSDFTCRAMPFYNPLDRMERLPIYGNWSYTQEGDVTYITIDVPENPMNGRYKVDFYRDYKKKALKMKLSNPTIEFTCSKALQNFDSVKNW